MHRQRNLAREHQRPEVKAMLRLRRDPRSVDTKQQIHCFGERALGKLWQGQAMGGSPKSGSMSIGTKHRDSAILLPKSIEALEDGLRVVEDRGPGIQLQTLVRPQLRIVPTTLPIPKDAGHVLGENPAE